MLDVVPKIINEDIVKFLASQVQLLTPKDVDDVTLDFLVNVTLLTAKTIEKEPEISSVSLDEDDHADNPFRKNFGLYLIWRLTLNKSNVTPDFRMKVFTRLKKLVLAPEFQDQRLV